MKAIIKRIMPAQLFLHIAPIWHLLVALLMSARYGFPARKMKFIGITGTNGKTTTTFMVHRMLREAGLSVGMMSTVAFGTNDNIQPQMEHMSTVSAPELQRRLRDFSREKISWVVMETTSHALAQHRVWGLPYVIAVLTNITHEHLEYHGTFARYVAAKRRLFKMAKCHDGYAVANADDPQGGAFLAATGKGITYGLKGGTLRAVDVKLTSTSSQFRVTGGNADYQITCHIPGEFNIYNSLAAIAVGERIGLTKDQIERGIASLVSVEGRMNTVQAGQAFGVIIDYAHTPDSFEKLLSDIRSTTKGKLIVVFGSGGERDTAKRGEQGKIAGTYADVVIATEEDDRNEEPQQILEMIAAGAETAGMQRGVSLLLIPNRTDAIATAMTTAQASEHPEANVVLLLGKGHEKTIARADGEYPWNERAVAEAAIVRLANSA